MPQIEPGRKPWISVNERGRITIPAPVRREAGIVPGTPLAVIVEDGRVVIETCGQLADRLRRQVSETWIGDPDASAAKELIAERRAEAAAEEAATAKARRASDV
jgi:AbrB family looped-hinge helix DNA binding protein